MESADNGDMNDEKNPSTAKKSKNQEPGHIRKFSVKPVKQIKVANRIVSENLVSDLLFSGMLPS